MTIIVAYLEANRNHTIFSWDILLSDKDIASRSWR